MIAFNDLDNIGWKINRIITRKENVEFYITQYIELPVLFDFFEQSSFKTQVLFK